MTASTAPNPNKISSNANDNQAPPKEELTLEITRRKILHSAAFLAAFLAIYGAIVYCAAGGSWATAGTIGDTFGAMNAFFSGLAFLGIIVNLFMQREELSLQRKELSLTREQLEKSADAQEENVENSVLSFLAGYYREQIDIHKLMLDKKLSIEGSRTSTPAEIARIKKNLTSLSARVTQIEALTGMKFKSILEKHGVTGDMPVVETVF